MKKQLGALAAGAALLVGVGATNAGAAAVSGAQVVRTITYGKCYRTNMVSNDFKCRILLIICTIFSA